MTYSAEIVGKLEQPDRDGIEETGWSGDYTNGLAEHLLIWCYLANLISKRLYFFFEGIETFLYFVIIWIKYSRTNSVIHTGYQYQMVKYVSFLNGEGLKLQMSRPQKIKMVSRVWMDGCTARFGSQTAEARTE